MGVRASVFPANGKLAALPGLDGMDDAPVLIVQEDAAGGPEVIAKDDGFVPGDQPLDGVALMGVGNRKAETARDLLEFVGAHTDKPVDGAAPAATQTFEVAENFVR